MKNRSLSSAPVLFCLYIARLLHGNSTKTLEQLDGKPGQRYKYPLRLFDGRFLFRGVAQLGRALRSGRRGREFKSRHPDFVLN